jgi:hypothetical protein
LKKTAAFFFFCLNLLLIFSASSTFEAPFLLRHLWHLFLLPELSFSYFIASFPCFIKILFVLSAVASILSLAFWQHYLFYFRQHLILPDIFFSFITFAESTTKSFCNSSGCSSNDPSGFSTCSVFDVDFVHATVILRSQSC